MPLARGDQRARAAVLALKDRAAADPLLAPLGRALADPRATDLLEGIFAGSPYLSGLIEREPQRLQRILTTAPETRLAELKTEFENGLSAAATRCAHCACSRPRSPC
jgi:glutamate-ammonia-ligase adenylyltransferase